MDRPPPCRFYQAGFCINDDLCPFSHPTQRCHTFTTNGWCPYGVSCHFWHDPSRAFDGSQSSPVQNQQVCRFFLNGQCKYGDTCAYSHQLDLLHDDSHLTLSEYRRQKAMLRRPQNLVSHSNLADCRYREPSYQRKEVPPTPSRPPTARPTARLEQAFLDTIHASDLEQMRQLDIDRLLKRYPSHQLKEVKDNESARSFNLLFSSTDPDWSYEVRKIVVCLTLPAEYPLTPPVFSVPKTSDIPNAVTEHLNCAIADWLSERNQSYRDANKVALYLRPFLFWLDKKLLTLFHEGYAKLDSKAEVVSPSSSLSDELLNIPDRFSESSSSISSSNESTEESSTDDEFNETEQKSVALNTVDNKEVPSISSQLTNDEAVFCQKMDDRTDSLVPDSSYRQQRIAFENLEFRGQAGTCLFTKFSASCFCSRCKYIFQWVFRLPSQPLKPENVSPAQLQSLPPTKATCIRCRQSLGLLFDAVLAHSFSGVIGDFSVANCMVCDVQIKTAEVNIQCTNCSTIFKLTGLEADRLVAKRCKNCHSPCGLIFSNVTISSINALPAELSNRFASLSLKTSSELPSSSKAARRSKRSVLSGSQAHVMQKGTPLPDEGTCKHYAKSYRWFRFQCCNRVYPCDVCHNEEAAGSHELLFAQRIICGFCSKEQAYSSLQKCIACHKSLTGSHTTHWEGGKGCRDQVKMSRKDNKKFANLSKKQPK